MAHCITGVQFLILADPGHTALEVIAKKIYELYSDYVLKNPFYTIEQPIRFTACNADRTWHPLTHSLPIDASCSTRSSRRLSPQINSDDEEC